MKNLNTLVSTLLGVAFSVAFLEIDHGNKAVAQVRTPCLPTHTTADLQNITCTVAAQTYGITIYRIAICTDHPMPSGGAVLASCESIYNNASGQYVDLGLSNPEFANIELDPNYTSDPRSGTYNFIYLQIGTTWNIKATATVASGTWYTSTELYNNGDGQNAATQSVGRYAVFPNVMTRFSGACQENNSYGGKNALLTASLQSISLSGGACPGSAFTSLSANATSLLGAPVVITNQTMEIDLRFRTTEDSIGLWAAADGTYVFGSLGFQLNLTTSN